MAFISLTPVLLNTVHAYTLSMPGGDPLATCTLPVGDVYLLTYLGPLNPESPNGGCVSDRYPIGAGSEDGKGQPRSPDELGAPGRDRAGPSTLV